MFVIVSPARFIGISIAVSAMILIVRFLLMTPAQKAKMKENKASDISMWIIVAVVFLLIMGLF